MERNIPNKTLEGLINLSVSSSDPVTWKLAMLMEAANMQVGKIEDIAKRYGYTREHFYVIQKAFMENGSNGLVDKPKGPKSDYRRTDQIKKEIIRHRFLDPEASCQVIAQKMNQAGRPISQRSVERTINDYGLQKKGYIKQIRQRKRS
ncbi:MAG: helix-turn-helix domain-containing protein [Bacteroidales bacterium]|nr:helix-turn-helix domain-containing protein [Bacteroidales bacterium]